jgi:YHS domain-containing protein
MWHTSCKILNVNEAKGEVIMENTATARSIHVDPVCGMEVDPGSTRLVANFQGHSYWFCNEACLNSFETNPKKYLEPKPTKRKGIWGRYLERLNRATNGKPLKCH